MPAADCSFTCSGSDGELCGAGNRLSVYSSNGASQTFSPPTVPSTSGGVATGTAVPNPVPSVPVATSFPDGWTYQGCWVDGVSGRILPVQEPDSQTLTPQGCAQACQTGGYTISGTEWSQQCFCGNYIINGGVAAADDSACNTPCSGDAKQMCGSGGHMSIVSTGTPAIQLPPAVQTSGLNGSWSTRAASRTTSTSSARCSGSCSSPPP